MGTQTRRISNDLVKEIETLRRNLQRETGKDITFSECSRLFAIRRPIKIETSGRKRLKIDYVMA